MLARELAEKLLENPEAEVTISLWDGDYSVENQVDGVLDWQSFVSIQHSKARI